MKNNRDITMSESYKNWSD